MRVSILTPDSKIPNLAAMKISTYHKERGDEVLLNMPIVPADKTYASVLFEWTPVPIADEVGGPGYDPTVKLQEDIDRCKPDYTLYPDIEYSLGFTYKACHRGCDFCKVPLMGESNEHYSIWDFHLPRFKKIALLNNNTFEDPKWKETFQEIWDAGLRIKDMSGYDARLMTKERGEALAKTKWDGQVHFAWDKIRDSEKVLKGLELVMECGLKPYKMMCYVLIGYDTTKEEDLYRVETLRSMKIDPFVMPINKHDIYQKRFARWVNHKAVFKSVKWEDYK